MAAKNKLTGAVTFNGETYYPGQEQALEEAFSAHEATGDHEQQQKNKAQVERSRAHLAKHGVYGEAGEDGSIVSISNPDPTLRAGALGRKFDPVGTGEPVEGEDQREKLVRTNPVDLTPANMREGAVADTRTGTVVSEATGAANSAKAPSPSEADKHAATKHATKRSAAKKSSKKD